MKGTTLYSGIMPMTPIIRLANQLIMCNLQKLESQNDTYGGYLMELESILKERLDPAVVNAPRKILNKLNDL